MNRQSFAFLVFLVVASSPFVVRAEDAPPVVELRKLHREDKDFRSSMEQALANVATPYNGGENPWKGRTFDDFCNFFNAWYELLPVNNGSPRNEGFIPGQHVDEFVYIKQFAGFYYQNEFGRKVVMQDPGLSWTKKFVAERGRFMDSRESAEAVQAWIDDPSIHIDEYVVPSGGFASFNDFFARSLKPGMRTLASPEDDSVLVSPTDCVLNMIQPLTPEAEIPTKFNQKLNVRQLLNGSEHARHFEHGTAVSCILLPNTYHHYHAVVSGTIVESDEDVAGAYWGMNFPAFFNGGNIGYGQSYSVFEHYRRGYVIIETKDYGHVAMVPVGLDTIGSVSFEDGLKKVSPSRPVPIRKGDRIGHFAYGGSMVIVLVEQGMASVTIPQGQQIGVFSGRKSAAPAKASAAAGQPH